MYWLGIGMGPILRLQTMVHVFYFDFTFFKIMLIIFLVYNCFTLLDYMSYFFFSISLRVQLRAKFLDLY